MFWTHLVLVGYMGASMESLDSRDKDGGTSLAFYAKYVIRGNYVIGSTGLRFTGSGSINISGLPSSPEIVKAYLIYSVVASSSQPQGFINGTPLSGVLVGSGPSPCWTESFVYTYVADVTPVVQSVGNGTYTLTGFYNPGGDPPPGGAEGATLVVIFCDQGNTVRSVVVYLGAYTLNFASGPSSYTWNLANFIATNPVTSARTTLIFADGQDYWNESQFGIPCGLEYVYFNGYLIRSGQYGLPGGDGNLWDAVHIANAASYIPGGASSVSGSLSVDYDPSWGDCITTVGHILSVSSTEAETYNCVLSSEEGFADDHLAIRVAGNRAFLSVPFPVNGSLRLYRSDGRLVGVLADGKLSSCEIGLPRLEPGVYFLKLRTDIGDSETKVLIWR
ncbi:MAG: hypothetical protein ABIM19_04830 [candidate division WOR-3 bacterium]